MLGLLSVLGLAVGAFAGNASTNVAVGVPAQVAPLVALLSTDKAELPGRAALTAGTTYERRKEDLFLWPAWYRREGAPLCHGLL